MNPLDLLLWMAVGWSGLIIAVSIPAMVWIAWRVWGGKL